jgi:hypothetical protein
MANIPADMKVTLVEGLAGGPTIQFGTGNWQDGAVRGVAISEEAFDLLEPTIQQLVPEWRPLARYGVTELSRSSLIALIEGLRALELADPDAVRMKVEVADWLSHASRQPEPVTIFGL